MTLERETLDAVTEIAPIARHTMATAMVDGITDTGISTVANVTVMVERRENVIETNYKRAVLYGAAQCHFI